MQGRWPGYVLLGLLCVICLGSACATSGQGKEAPVVAPKADAVRKELLTVDPTPLRAPQAKEGGELRLAVRQSFQGFNFLTGQSAELGQLQELFVGNSLARRHYAAPSQWHGELAESITVNEDHTVYHVRLRKGVKWHRATVDLSEARHQWLDKEHLVTSDDFKFMLEMMRDERVSGAARLRIYFKALDRIEVINDHEFKLHWKEGLFQSMDLTMALFPLPRWLYAFEENGLPIPAAQVGARLQQHWYKDRAIGTGPFRFVSYEPGQSVLLERNEDYFEGKPALERVRYRIIEDQELMLQAFLAGELDVMSLTPAQYQAQVVERRPAVFSQEGAGQETPFVYQQSTRLAYRYLGWNLRDPRFRDAQTRRALTLALDRQRAVREVLHGLGQVQTGHSPMHSPWSDPSVEAYPFDLEEARALLAQAGWQDKDGDGVLERTVEGAEVEFAFTLLILDTNPDFQSLAALYQEDLAKVGVQARVEVVGWLPFIQRMRGADFQAFLGGWSLSWEPDPYSIFHSSQVDLPEGSNFVGFQHAEADQIMEALRVTFDPEERRRLQHRFHQILHQEQPYTFWVAPEEVLVYPKSLKGVQAQEPWPHHLLQRAWKE